MPDARQTQPGPAAIVGHQRDGSLWSVPYTRFGQRAASDRSDESAGDAGQRPGGGDVTRAGPGVDGKRVRRGNDDIISVFDLARPLEDMVTPSTRRGEGPAAYSGASSQRQPVALVVDDEQIVGSLIRRLLIRNGWHAIVVADAEDALSRYEAAEIDLLITDIELPGVSGAALAGLLRERDPGLPIIVVSGWPDAADLVEGGRTAFVPKPIDIEEFMTQVRTLAN